MTRREIAALCLFAVMLLLGGLSVNTAEHAARTQETDLIRDAVRSAALTCYAVDYDAFASNLMPEIRVVEIGGTNS